MTNLEIINLLQEAIELGGDGGARKFTSEEYEAMYNFLDQLKNI